ncbi:SCO5717 family growth-regulating ATPase, partial [Streptomyces coelicoflavus]|uniref:SCO5717 family growth-regulating ATPase n=1 Tax=Streptomyces coelicoflavus TaxID=285562 RepID=UPI0030B8DA2C
MSSDRDGIRGGWATPGDDQPDAESSVEATGEFTIDYAPPAWYTQNASGDGGQQQGEGEDVRSASGSAASSADTSGSAASSSPSGPAVPPGPPAPRGPVPPLPGLTPPPHATPDGAPFAPAPAPGAPFTPPPAPAPGAAFTPPPPPGPGAPF